MGLPKRPEVVVHAPEFLVAGETATIDVVLDVAREVTVDFLDVRLIGTQGWTQGGGNSRVWVTEELPRLTERLLGPATLPVGTHTYEAAFTLPARTPPSHELWPAHARVRIEVHASIPWWPDGRYSFNVPVRLPPPARAERTPAVLRSPERGRDESPSDPRIEVALASTTVVAGETLTGSCALLHIDARRAHDIEVRLEPQLRLKGRGDPRLVNGPGIRSSFTIPPGSAGKAVPFSVALPDTMTATFASQTHDLMWVLVVRSGSVFSRPLVTRTPLHVLDAEAKRQIAPLREVPRLTDERMGAVFERVASDTGFRVVTEAGAGEGHDLLALVLNLGDSEVRLEHAYRDEAGTFLLGRVQYPRLGLALQISASTRWRDRWSTDLEVDLEAWDRAHRFEAREAAQAVPFVREMLRSPHLAAISLWTDDELVIERSVDTVEVGNLSAFARAMVEVAARIAEARRVILPPSRARIVIDDWRDLAAGIEGRFVPGDLGLSGMLDRLPVSGALTFDEDLAPVAYRVAVGASALARPRVREASLAVEVPYSSPASDAGTIPERVRAVLASWPAAGTVSVSDGVACALLTLPGGLDAARVREVFRALRALLAAYDEPTGPYR